MSAALLETGISERRTNIDTVRTIPAVLGFGAGLAIAQGFFDYTGGSLFGYGLPAERDEYEHKEMLRTTRRRPLQETIEQLGEGRGRLGLVSFQEACI